MRIDSHLHVWSFDHVEYGEEKPLLTYMEEHGLDMTSLIAVTPEENLQVKELVQRYPDRFFGIAHVDRQHLEDSLAQLQEGVLKGYYKGIKVLSYAGGFPVDDEVQMRIYEKCLGLDIPVLFHVGWHNAGSVKPSDAAAGANSCRYACAGTPVELGGILERFPELKVVFAHMGGEYYFQCLGIAQRFPHVHLDTAWLEHYGMQRLPQITNAEWIAHACQYLGAEKVLYGGEYTMPEEIKEVPINQVEKDLILGDNARRLYRL